MLGLVIGIWIWQLMIYLRLVKICDLLDKHRGSEDKEKLSWLGKNCKDCGNKKCKKLGTLPKGYDCALWQPEREGKE